MVQLHGCDGQTEFRRRLSSNAPDCSCPVPSSFYSLSFFFSSRRRHTRYIGDWSSDVCSSDLEPGMLITDPGVDCKAARRKMQTLHRLAQHEIGKSAMHAEFDDGARPQRVHEPEAEWRSEERRVGKECRAGWPQEHERKKYATH